MALVLAGCSREPAIAPFNVIVRGPTSSCTIEVSGRQVTTEELLEISRREVKPGRAAHIDANMKETPYRCIGGVISTLQRAGFKKVEVRTDPPPS
jgi:hypothetical protein